MSKSNDSVDGKKRCSVFLQTATHRVKSPRHYALA